MPIVPLFANKSFKYLPMYRLATLSPKTPPPPPQKKKNHFLIFPIFFFFSRYDYSSPWMGKITIQF